jgi:hypothetical protein
VLNFEKINQQDKYMRLARALDDKKFDIRLSDKFVADEKISKKELEQYLKELPDDAETSTTTQDVEDARTNS